MKLWMDFPPSATLPVYKDKIYAKVLRLPKGVKPLFKDDGYYRKKQQKVTSKSGDLIETNIQPNKNKGDQEDPGKFNSSGSGFKANAEWEGLFTSSPGPNQNMPSNQNSQSTSQQQTHINPNQSNIPKPHQNVTKSDNNRSSVINDAKNVNASPIKPQISNNNRSSSQHKSGSVFVNQSQQQNPMPNIQHIDVELIMNNLKGDDENISPNKSPERPKQQQSKTTNANQDDPWANLSNLNFIPETSPSNTQKQNSSQPVINLSSYSGPYDRFQGDEDSIKEQIEAWVKKWLYALGERKNLRMILGTLHEVWLIDETWKEVSMQKLVEDPASVNTNYRKAMKQLHPDKNRNQEMKVKLVAECLFQILNEANVQLPK
jgi:hypothetical protein